jgi:hypothetical protein
VRTIAVGANGTAVNSLSAVTELVATGVIAPNRPTASPGVRNDRIWRRPSGSVFDRAAQPVRMT